MGNRIGSAFSDTTGPKPEEPPDRLLGPALDFVSQGVVIASRDRLMVYANPAFTEITGYTAEEIIGRSCRMLQGPETDPLVVEEIRSCLAADRPFSGEILNYRKDGRAFWNELSINPVREAVETEDGDAAVRTFSADPERFSVVLMDLTMPRLDGRRAYEQLLKIRPDARVVLMSGYNEDEAVSKFEGRPPLDFLHKPFGVEVLRDVLRRAIPERADPFSPANPPRPA